MGSEYRLQSVVCVLCGVSCTRRSATPAPFPAQGWYCGTCQERAEKLRKERESAKTE